MPCNKRGSFLQKIFYKKIGDASQNVVPHNVLKSGDTIPCNATSCVHTVRFIIDTFSRHSVLPGTKKAREPCEGIENTLFIPIVYQYPVFCLIPETRKIFPDSLPKCEAPIISETPIT